MSYCAFESAATKNSHRQVVVLLGSKSKVKSVPDYLAMFKNLVIVKTDFGNIVKGTVFHSHI